MEKKYTLTEETIEIDGHTLHRIKALRKFNDVKKGALGGYIENEDNLSHEGNCWVYDEAKVYEDACIFGDVQVSNKPAKKHRSYKDWFGYFILHCGPVILTMFILAIAIFYFSMRFISNAPQS